MVARAWLAAGFGTAAGLLILGASMFKRDERGGGPAVLVGFAATDGRMLGVIAALTGGAATAGPMFVIGLNAIEAEGGLIAPPGAEAVPGGAGSKAWVDLEVSARLAGAKIWETGARACKGTTAGGTAEEETNTELGVMATKGAEAGAEMLGGGAMLGWSKLPGAAPADAEWGILPEASPAEPMVLLLLLLADGWNVGAMAEASWG